MPPAPHATVLVIDDNPTGGTAAARHAGPNTASRPSTHIATIVTARYSTGRRGISSSVTRKLFSASASASPATMPPVVISTFSTRK